MNRQSDMPEKTVLIQLDGKLGAEFGREYRLAVSSVKEATRALCIMIPGFEKFLNNSEKLGLTYAVFNGKRNVSEDEIQLNGVKDIIRFVPVIIGSKKAGLFQTILGVALVAIGFVASFTPFAAASPFLFKMGAVAILGGVAQMLAPVGTSGITDTKDTTKSYSFGSPGNTSAAGRCVPILWGRRIIGGPIISAGIYVEQQQS
ncbi:tail assembly protein [Yersinia intermedia]|nr:MULTISPECIES: tail assembly protein [Yersinia]MCB5311900.1 tail assembly protein [Yersinia intermedia]MCB5325375.1 tail assembly protein [Yersinia intermedia]